MANSPSSAKQLAMLAIQSAYPGKSEGDVVDLTLSGMAEMVERAIGLGMETTREGGGADLIPLLYANADAASGLWLAVTHAIHGLNLVAMEVTERARPDDDIEGYASLLHVAVGHLRGAADSFEKEFTDTYRFPHSLKRPEAAHA